MNTNSRTNQSSVRQANGSRTWFGLIGWLVVIIAVAAWLNVPTANADAADVVVYKTASCGCCNSWIAHLRDAGLEVSVVNVASTEATPVRLGVPSELGSCHTAVVGKYWVEGHVPADLVQRLMAEQPDDIRGIAAPGMPMGAPGMESPNAAQYQVMAYGTDGETSVYATREGQSSPQ